MKYILSQDETRQDNSDKDNETTSESADDNKDDSNSEPDIRVYGTEDNTDYSIDGMLAIAKDINSDMNNKDVKGVVLVLNKKYSEDVRYFLSLTVKDDINKLYICRNMYYMQFIFSGTWKQYIQHACIICQTDNIPCAMCLYFFENREC